MILSPSTKCDRTFNGTPWVVYEVEWCVEKRVNGIAHDFINHPAVLDDDGSGALEVVIKDCYQSFWIGPPRHGRKILDVGKEGGYFTPLTLELHETWLFHNPSNNFRREMLLKTPDARGPHAAAIRRRQ